MPSLFDPYDLGVIYLKNRIVMAPMERSRARNADLAPNNGALNTRNDRSGGRSIENRLRFTLETVDAIAAAIGSERTGIRLSPFGRYNDMPPFEGEAETYLKLAAELSSRKLAYVHISDQTKWADASIPKNYLKEFRQAYHGTLILAGGYLKANGQAALDADEADLIAVGKPFLANPDLVERLRNNWPLNEPDRATFYTAGTQGYIDYPICRKEDAGQGIPPTIPAHSPALSELRVSDRVPSPERNCK